VEDDLTGLLQTDLPPVRTDIPENEPKALDRLKHTPPLAHSLEAVSVHLRQFKAYMEARVVLPRKSEQLVAHARLAQKQIF
jgi:hypothetical protein